MTKLCSQSPMQYCAMGRDQHVTMPRCRANASSVDSRPISSACTGPSLPEWRDSREPPENRAPWPESSTLCAVYCHTCGTSLSDARDSCSTSFLLDGLLPLSSYLLLPVFLLHHIPLLQFVKHPKSSTPLGKRTQGKPSPCLQGAHSPIKTWHNPQQMTICPTPIVKSKCWVITIWFLPQSAPSVSFCLGLLQRSPDYML
jgi:hypothetical protein